MRIESAIAGSTSSNKSSRMVVFAHGLDHTTNRSNGAMPLVARDELSLK